MARGEVAPTRGEPVNAIPVAEGTAVADTTAVDGTKVDGATVVDDTFVADGTPAAGIGVEFEPASTVAMTVVRIMGVGDLARGRSISGGRVNVARGAAGSVDDRVPPVVSAVSVVRLVVSVVVVGAGVYMVASSVGAAEKGVPATVGRIVLGDGVGFVRAPSRVAPSDIGWIDEAWPVA